MYDDSFLYNQDIENRMVLNSHVVLCLFADADR